MTIADATFRFESKDCCRIGDLNATPFVERHNVADDPLFSLDRLAELAERVRRERGEQYVFYQQAETVPHLTKPWSNTQRLPTIGDVIRGCATSGAWVSIHESECDPEYDRLIRGVVAEMGRLAGRDLLAESRYITGHFFIGSPNSVTNYHMDSETNFLVIASGSKLVNVFNGRDRALLSERDIEEFYRGTNLTYHPLLQDAAKEFHVGAGDCLHIPVNFPHWVKNGPEPCVALAVLIYLPENVDRAFAFQTNYLLRKAGFSPSSIGDDPGQLRRRGWLMRSLSTRRPSEKLEVINSGLRRLMVPVGVARKITRKFLSR